MRKRISDAETTPVRVVIVTMDSHLAGAVERAHDSLRRELPGLDLVVHSADEWDGDSEALARCHADIARGDIVIATMLFLEDHIRAVLPALEARRNTCDAMVCCLSAGEVVRLTRIGRFDMSAQANGVRRDAEAAARQRQSRAIQRRRPDEDAAAIAEAAALHPRHRAGRARLFPDPAILAGRLGRKSRQHGPAPGPALRPGSAQGARRPSAHRRAAALSGCRALSSQGQDADRREAERTAAQPPRQRHGRRAGDAVLCAGWKFGAL